MSDLGKQAVLQLKYARIISCIADEASVGLDEAMNMFYNSETMQLIQDGIADLHCRSDQYLAGEVIRELSEDK